MKLPRDLEHTIIDGVPVTLSKIPYAHFKGLRNTHFFIKTAKNEKGGVLILVIYQDADGFNSPKLIIPWNDRERNVPTYGTWRNLHAATRKRMEAWIHANKDIY